MMTTRAVFLGGQETFEIIAHKIAFISAFSFMYYGYVKKSSSVFIFQVPSQERRKSNQRYVFFLMESPLNDGLNYTNKRSTKSFLICIFLKREEFQ